ncbi:MAG TPA: hypothetical protein VNT01_05785 [Symbiobacteriaceae bacterium]|nr:hypothetical protein [Symbiobacteriaceae bacterium]
MKRTLITVTSLLVLLAVLWFASPNLLQGDAVYTVKTGSDGNSALLLRIDSPGPFVDLLPAPDGSYTQGGNLRPWPGTDRRRFVTLFRGPLELTLAEGTGPFDLSNLPRPATGAAPSVQVPEGWRQIGQYAGQFQVVEGSPVAVAVPVGMADAPGVADKVRKLYTATQKLLGRPPVREQPAVVTGPEPERLGRAATELWIPDYPAEFRWLQTGAARYYAVKALDQTKVWSSTDSDQWERKYGADKDYALALWLDVSMRLEKRFGNSLDTVLMQAQNARTVKDLVTMVGQIGGLYTGDHLDRMLKGIDPLPVTK